MLVIEKNADPKWLLAMEKLATKNSMIKNLVIEKLAIKNVVIERRRLKMW
jgi:hypothetical protein